MFVVRTAEAQCLKCCATNRKVVGSIPAGIVYIKLFLSHYDTEVDSASKRNESHENFLVVKAAGTWAENLTTILAFVMISWNLNFLE
jgi:hypothetical protein